MGRRKKTPLLIRLIPNHSVLRFIFVVAALFTVYILGSNTYRFYEIKMQESRLTEEKERLLEEQKQLQEKKDSLEDPAVIEKKAREDLGLVKEREVPYVK